MVLAGDPNPLLNTVTATAIPQGLSTPISKTASASVAIVHPGLLVTKIADPTTASPGNVVTYTITIKNTGDVNLNSITVADPLLGGTLAGYPTTLAPGASAVQTFPYTVLVTDPNPLVNTVTFTATPQGLTPQSTTASASVVVLTTSSLLITKIANVTTAKPGDVITYTITIKNIGTVQLNSISVSDTLLGGTLAGFPTTLAVGASASNTFNYTVLLTDPNPLTNTATFTATPQGRTTPQSATSTANVTIVHPAITVTKVADKTVAQPGDIITYTITVKNTGDVTLNSLTVTDSLLGPLGGFGTSLAPGVSVTRAIAYTVKVADPNPLVNTVTAAAIPQGLSTPVTASTSASVPIVHPSLSVTKTANVTTAYVGNTIMYTVTITNTGDVALNGIVVNDSLLGSPLPGFPSTLLPGNAATQTFNYVVKATDISPLVNTVIFSGTPTGFTTPISATASASVLIGKPSIAVLKATATTITTVGGTVIYFITIQNTGTVTLNNIVEMDPLLGGALSGFPDSLAPGTALTRSYSYVVKSTDTSPLVNTVTFSGTPQGSTTAISATSSVSVVIAHPGLLVIKTPSCCCAQVGDDITYTITVTNTGDVTLNGLTVVDPLLGHICGFPSTLAAGASATKQFTYTVQRCDVSPLINIATATAMVQGLATAITATGTTTVQLIHPRITVTKTADKKTACPGDVITYTITATNAGDVPVDNIKVTDCLIGELSPCFSTKLAPGACETHCYCYTVQPCDTSPLVNTVNVTGNVCCCCTTEQVSACASVSVTITKKKGDADLYIYNADSSKCVGYRIFSTTGCDEVLAQCGGAGCDIKYPFTVENTSSGQETITINGYGCGSGWKVRYYDTAHGNKDITSQVTGSGFVLKGMDAGATRNLLLVVTPQSNLPSGSTYTVNISATVNTDATVSDVVQAASSVK